MELGRSHWLALTTRGMKSGESIDVRGEMLFKNSRIVSNQFVSNLRCAKAHTEQKLNFNVTFNFLRANRTVVLKITRV